MQKHVQETKEENGNVAFKGQDQEQQSLHEAKTKQKWGGKGDFTNVSGTKISFRENICALVIANTNQ